MVLTVRVTITNRKGDEVIKFFVKGIGWLYGFESETGRDAYEKYVDRKWTDRGYDKDSCLYWLY